MATQGSAPNLWAKLPVSIRALISGLAIALVAANVWPLLLLSLGVPLAAVVEVIFLVLYLWWTTGGGPPRSTQGVRGEISRSGGLLSRQWFWGITAAVFFAVTIHSAIVLLFRFVPFPTAAFRSGYDFSFIPSLRLRWVAVVISAMSAGICEETGFRGYMQWPIEQQKGVFVAVLVSSFFFTVVHLTKGWAMIGMIPIVFGAGVLLGVLAWAAGSLVPCMIGHVLMDIGLFAYWWTGIAGDFAARPISETGVDQLFFFACAVFVVSLGIVLLSISRLRARALAVGLTSSRSG
jgi:membrane protease YdiL (CAAX protease family)